ncbi:MAG: PilZ domain-containing protein [Candidatus Omnitrophota bacterium]
MSRERFFKEVNSRICLEKRETLRFNDFIFISYHLTDKPLEEYKAVTKNISCKGLMFELEKKVQPGTCLEFALYQPINQFKTIIFVIHTLARVVWMQKIKLDFFEGGENRYRMGIEFIRLKDSDREMIQQYVVDHQR